MSLCVKINYSCGKAFHINLKVHMYIIEEMIPRK